MALNASRTGASPVQVDDKVGARAVADHVLQSAAGQRDVMVVWRRHVEPAEWWEGTRRETSLRPC